MPYPAVSTQSVSPLTIHDAHNAIGNGIGNDASSNIGIPLSREKINFTTLSMFQACLLASLAAIPIWAAIGLMLAH